MKGQKRKELKNTFLLSFWEMALEGTFGPNFVPPFFLRMKEKQTLPTALLPTSGRILRIFILLGSPVFPEVCFY